MNIPEYPECHRPESNGKSGLQHRDGECPLPAELLCKGKDRGNAGGIEHGHQGKDDQLDRGHDGGEGRGPEKGRKGKNGHLLPDDAKHKHDTGQQGETQEKDGYGGQEGIDGFEKTQGIQRGDGNTPDNVGWQDYPDERFCTLPGLAEDNGDRRHVIIGHLHDHAHRFTGQEPERQPPENHDEKEVDKVECQRPPDIHEQCNDPEDNDRPCRAGYERDQERCQELLLGGLNDPAGEAGRHRTAKAEHERDDRLPVKPHLVHTLVQHQGEPGEEPGVLDLVWNDRSIGSFRLCRHRQ